jgi:purine-nucleoside/S-methyl-5'-thioadenosine phosphorylase / adenosine deaminase
VLQEPFYELGDHIAIDLPGARAVFTTRRGGVSRTPYDTLNFGLLTDDDPAAVRTNRERVAEKLGVKFAWRKQVHGAEVHVVDAPWTGDEMPADGDAVVTRTKGVAPLVLAADCVPIAIAGPGVVAMVHAGWQGLAKGVIAATVEAIGGQATAAAIGPAAGVCCYEVSDELIQRFASLGHGARRDGRNLDLKGIAADQLSQAGVRVVDDVKLCTICAPRDLLFSHRADNGVTGRQAGIVWLT